MHGQWASNAVVEGYIAYSKPLCMQHLNCLLTESKSKKEEVTQENTELVKYNQIVELTKEVVDLQNLSKKEEEALEKRLTLYGFSQNNDPDYAIAYLDSTTDGVPVLSASKVQPGPKRIIQRIRWLTSHPTPSKVCSLHLVQTLRTVPSFCRSTGSIQSIFFSD